MWSPGDVVLGVYEVRDVVRTGGMGLVYRVWHRQWGMELAVKTPRQELVASPADAERFEAEAEAWVNLGAHPHVVSCAYVRRIDDTPRVFAEWVDGGSLAEAVRDGALYRDDGHSVLRRVLDLAIQSAWGLGHAHDQGLVHQDVKPANIMLDRNGAAKVTDFGLAHVRVAGDREEESLVTANGMTLEYCSPEQARGERLGPATDVWSWAVSVFEMFAGRPPTVFGHAAAGVLAQFLEVGAENPAVPAPPPGVGNLLRRCLAEDPASRPTGFGAIADELLEIYRDTVFEPYPRQRPDEAPLLADGLSNRALSLLDLGRADQADQLWEQALRVDPRHAHATYNRGLRGWRSGQRTDRQLIAELDAVRLGQPGDPVADHLLALVHIERGDKDSATRLLRDLPDSPDVAAARAVADALPDRRVSQGPSPTWLDQRYPFALSADGRLAAVTFRDRELRLWSLESGRVVHQLRGHEGPVRSVSLSADGQVLVSADEVGQVRVWDTGSGRCTRVHDLPPIAVRSVAVSPDGTVVAAVGVDGSLRLLGDTTDVICDAFAEYGAQYVQYGGGRGGAIAISADNTRVVVFDDYVWELRVLDLRTRELLWAVGDLRQHCAISSAARFALSATQGKKMRLLDLTTFEVTDLGDAVFWNDGFSWLAVGEDGRTAVNAFGRTVQAWRLDQRRCAFTTAVESRNPMHVALSANGQVVLVELGTGSPTRTTSVVHIPEPGPAAPWSYARPQPTDRIAGDALVAEENLDLAGDLLETGRLVDAWQQLDIVRRMPAYRRHPRLRVLWRRLGAVSERTAFAGVWPTRRFDDALRGGWAVTRNLRYAFADHHGRGVRVLDLRTGAEVDSPDQHELRFERATACADDRHVLVTDSEHAEVLWDLRTARRVGVVVRDVSGTPALVVENPNFEFVRRAGISVLRNRLTGQRVCGWSAQPDERVVLSGDTAVRVRDDGRVWVLDARDLTTVRQALLPAGELVRMRRSRPDGGFETTGGGPVVVSADGRVVVAARHQFGNGGNVVLSVAGAPATVAKVADDGVVSLALTADGDLLLTASQRLIRLWHLRTGELVTEVECDQDVNAVEMSADGSAFLAVLGHFHIQCWELDWDYQVRAQASGWW
ncbi:protein kinase domain-containing protein [Plantactinospora sp. WMMB782]|uniref:protein kinase domain-containing protein n=1 Tax=Plantactinospora sp. WMMB782 TaxID=3404121 RepID=UPI003B924E03